MAATREKFVKLAENRTRKAIKDIHLIGNLSNRATYSYNTDDVDQIFRAIEGEIRVARQRFQAKPANGGAEFNLS